MKQKKIERITNEDVYKQRGISECFVLLTNKINEIIDYINKTNETK